MSKRWLFFGVAFCSLFVVVGFVVVVRSWRKIVAACQMADWPHATGTVLSVEKIRKPEWESDVRKIVVRYTYTVADHAYEGNTIHPTYRRSNIEATHRGLEQKLAPGKKVRVYYRENAPEDSALAVGFYSGDLFLIFMGMTFVALGLFFIFIQLQSWRQERSTPPGGHPSVVLRFFTAGTLVAVLLGFLLTCLFGFGGNWDYASGVKVIE
jgi:hypothetical protein